MIGCENLSRRFGTRTVVDRISLRVVKGEIFGLVGPDGAGKTTLLRMLCGILDPSDGSLWRAEPTLGYMPQRFSLYGDLTVAENIDFFGAMYELDRSERRRRGEELLAFVGLLPFRSRFAEQLSGGMKQKLALSCALLSQPRLLLLDEPTYGVDPLSRQEFWQLLYRLRQEEVTIVVSTPFLDEAELCTRVAFLEAGQLLALDTPDGLRSAFPFRILELETGSPAAELLSSLPAVIESEIFGDRIHLLVRETESAARQVRERLQREGVEIRFLQEVAPSLEDVFIFRSGGGEI